MQISLGDFDPRENIAVLFGRRSFSDQKKVSSGSSYIGFRWPDKCKKQPETASKVWEMFIRLLDLRIHRELSLKHTYSKPPIL